LLAGCVTLYLTATVLCLPGVGHSIPPATGLLWRRPSPACRDASRRMANRGTKPPARSVCRLRPLFAAPYLHPARRGASDGFASRRRSTEWRVVTRRRRLGDVSPDVNPTAVCPILVPA